MPSNSQEELNLDQPAGFVSLETKTLYLQYRLDLKGKPEYSYKLLSSFGVDAARASDGRDQTDWSSFMPVKALVADLDIKIERDTTVIIEVYSENNDFYWSKTQSAVKTLNKHHSLYGDLLYRDGSEWKEKGAFDPQHCIAVSFKAKYGPKPPQGHKFSYFVRFRNDEGKLQEDEIDPDIKNPSA